MSRLVANLRVLPGGLIAWLAVGFLVWGFLLTPYALAAYDCKDHSELADIQCLKPIAQELRQDSNIATYATATVAAIIALQLSRRASESRSD